ncbi:3-deoxy-D-manno-octulosonic-acid transferase [gamma proteobacterium HdN1]|nr:3-deoxy-D-manno-octulosonic-acid transferase [gamma proteobacterium HdN1]
MDKQEPEKRGSNRRNELARKLYSGAFYGAIPLLAWRLYRRGRENPGYRDRVGERFGHFHGEPLTRSLWVHTVSVGEFLAAKGMIDWLMERYPGWPIVITTMTPTGADRVKAAYGQRVHHHYLPYDFPAAVNHLLDHIRPAILIIMETELWPNLVHFTHQREVPIVVANARLSEKSARGYARIHWLTAPMLAAIDRVAAQGKADANRFIALGLPSSAVEITGTIKFDLVIDDDLRARAYTLRERWGSARLVWIAASTHPGEDEQVLQAFRYLQGHFPHLLLVLVPRHPERFAPVAALVRQQGFKLQLHSQRDAVLPSTEVVLGDTMGELLLLMAASDVAFMGGSLEPIGGHNMLEPLAVGVPTICGPHVFNFATVAQLLTEHGVLTTVSSPLALANSVQELLEQPEQRAALAEKGMAVVDSHRGALLRLCRLLENLLMERGVG